MEVNIHNVKHIDMIQQKLRSYGNTYTTEIIVTKIDGSKTCITLFHEGTIELDTSSVRTK